MPPRLLVVDDDRSSRSVVVDLLARHGYQVDSCPTGSGALDLLSRRPYALAILDYQMPGMNGLEVFREAKRMQPELKGIFVTAFATIETVFPAVGEGIERVFAKPVDAQEFLPIVDELAGGPG